MQRPNAKVQACWGHIASQIKSFPLFPRDEGDAILTYTVKATQTIGVQLIRHLGRIQLHVLVNDVICCCMVRMTPLSPLTTETLSGLPITATYSSDNLCEGSTKINAHSINPAATRMHWPSKRRGHGETNNSTNQWKSQPANMHMHVLEVELLISHLKRSPKDDPQSHYSLAQPIHFGKKKMEKLGCWHYHVTLHISHMT